MKKISMKKILMVGIPAVIAAFLLVAYAAPSFGFGRGFHCEGRDFMHYKLDKLSKELNLNPAQQEKVETFKNDMDALMQQRLTKREEIHRAIREELSKSNPDMTKIAPLIDQQIDEVALIAHDLVSRIENFYGDLTPEQRKAFAEHVTEKMHEHEFD